MKKRLLYNEIKKQINHKNVLIITGMRQVGKTTLMHQIYDEIANPKLWFDFDNPLEQKFFEDDDYNSIYYRLVGKINNSDERLYVFIDEIQNFPEITKIIKYLIDHYSVKFIVTGSSNFYLKNLFPESLSGRKFLYYLPPMNFIEFLYFKDILNFDDIVNYDINYSIKQTDYFKYKEYDKFYDEFLNYGGFPEVVLTTDSETKELVLNNIIISFFEKDLKILSDYKNIRELRDLILLLVPRTGNIIDITKLSGELEINRVKIYDYLEFLQSTFFIKLVPKFSKSIDRSVASGKKIYFNDTGILNKVGKVTDGQLFENAVINQLAEYGNLSFYNKSNKAEIDAILDNNIAFEIKINGSLSDVNKVKNISEKIGINNSAIISRKYNEANFVYPVFL